MERLIDQMIDLNPFFRDIKRLIKIPRFRDYGIQMMIATINFEIIDKRTEYSPFLLHFFDHSGEEMVSFLITDKCINMDKILGDKHSCEIRKHMRKCDKRWVDIGELRFRYTPDGVATNTNSFYSYVNNTITFYVNLVEVGNYTVIEGSAWLGQNPSGTYSNLTDTSAKCYNLASGTSNNITFE